MTIYNEVFNNQLINLLEELYIIFPEEQNINNYINKLKIIKTIMPNTIFLYFKKCILPYKQNCINHDEQFFMDLNYDNILENDEESILHSIRFKELWKQMDDNSKKNFWKYIDILIKLSNKILSI